MDYIKRDDQQAEVNSEDVKYRVDELSNLQLALVGGGCGETVFH